MKILDILKRYWGYDDFRPMQREIIESVLAGNDTLGLLPTGGGKSITFQVPAMMLDGLTVVVTPLISLMKDQVDNLRDRGIKALYLHSGLTRRELRMAIDKCQHDRVDILYLSPEKLQSQSFLDEIRRFNVALIVVDEAHCISQWGYDFRPSYLKIAELRRVHPGIPVLALTASATPEVARDIMAKLEFRKPCMFSLSFKRDNLSYVVRYGDHKEQLLLRVLAATGGSAIVYVRSRKRTREIAAFLNDAGISADFYHAGLAPEDKSERQNRWKTDRTRVMVATNAFGMGIDKPDVRVVVHVDLPSSLEEYYQEAGRAGRDGKPAFAVLIASKGDKGVLTRRVNETFPPKDYVKKVYELAGNYLNIAVGSGYGTVNEFNFNLFCFRFSLKPVPTHNSLMLLTQAGYIEYVEEITTRSRLMVLLQKGELYDLRINKTNDDVLQLLLRTYPGLFADYVFINETLMATRLGLTDQQIYEALLALSRMHIIHYVPRKTTPYIVYVSSREEPRYIQLPDTIYKHRREQMERRVDAMRRFAFDTATCRVSTMLRYFGEEPEQDCGMCDVCRARKKSGQPAPADASLRETILYLASHPGGATLAHIASHTGRSIEDTGAAVRALVDQGLLTISGDTLLPATRS